MPTQCWLMCSTQRERGKAPWQSTGVTHGSVTFALRSNQQCGGTQQAPLVTQLWQSGCGQLHNCRKRDAHNTVPCCCVPLLMMLMPVTAISTPGRAFDTRRYDDKAGLRSAECSSPSLMNRMSRTSPTSLTSRMSHWRLRNSAGASLHFHDQSTVGRLQRRQWQWQWQ